MAWLWATTAVSRATLSSRIASTAPSPVLGVTTLVPARTSRAACSASTGSLLPCKRRWPLRGGRATSSTMTA